MRPDFTITKTIRDGITVLVLEGELDMASAPHLEAALADCPGGNPIIADLTRLTYIDSSGLHVLLKGQPAGGPTALVRTPASNIARVLQLINAHSTLAIFDELPTAIRCLEGNAA
jgi:anti-anti-sigma factor